MTFTDLPKLPVPHNLLAKYIAERPDTPIEELVGPYRKYENVLRQVYAQERDNPMLDDPYLNVLPLFTKDTPEIKTRARDLEAETDETKEKYIMSLPAEKRRPHGSPAVVQSLKEFRNNFGVFSESALVDLDFSNIVVAGSAVVNCILPVPENYNTSKRALRQYYHEKFTPASDVDIFVFGLTEEQAIEKIKDIETSVRDAILAETTVVRTKNAITICSQYPTRHIQIVLRVYKSVSEILTGFDIDCSGAAYDGTQVYTTPRALASYITQINPIDLTRRSPSYENRLSKYSHRNFEVYWPELDRSRVDPTIFERSFGRTLGLARLLVLERLPTTNAREAYMKKRREERGRPDLGHRFQYKLFGNIKDQFEDEVADWVDESEVSSYHTFSIPYGEKFHAKKIEKLCYTRDLLLNAEWNQQKDREVHLHRHPAFFGRVEDVIVDCCGSCPSPATPEEVEVAEKESEIYVSGPVKFRVDDPGRQQIGSFNPLSEADWCEMAYVGNTARLCQAIVDEDLEHVQDWLSQEGADVNQRDYTGRTPLHLAVTSSSVEVVRCLVDHGARLIACLADGRTALHLAASRGNVEMVKILLEKSAANEEEEEEKQDQRRKARDAAQKDSPAEVSSHEKESQVELDDDDDEEDSEGELVEGDDSDDDGVQSIATGSFVKVGNDDEDKSKSIETLPLDDNADTPDFYTIDFIAWDSKCSALHFAILSGNVEVVKLLSQEYAADILAPIKLGGSGDNYSDPKTAILTLVLALALPVEKAIRMAETLLSLGATSAQADISGVTALHRYVQHGVPKLVEALWENDKLGLKTAINHVAVGGSSWNPNATTPLMTAIDQGDPILVLRLLEAGASPQIDFDSWLKGAKFSFENSLRDFESNQALFKKSTEQPLIVAIRSSHPSSAIDLLERGVDPNVLTKASHDLLTNEWARRYQRGQSALDLVRDSLKALRKYKGEKTVFAPHSSDYGKSFFNPANNTYLEPPEGPQGTEEVLRKFQDGTFQHWVVSNDVTEKIDSYNKRLERFETDRKISAERLGVKEKLEAIQEAISDLERVEEALMAKGAKTFRQQYPDIQDNSENSANATVAEKSSQYDYDFSFPGVKDNTAIRQAAFIELFEAAWRGDLEKIKSFTLASWGVDGQEPPLKIAVFDAKGNNPFSVAFLKGHYEVAKAILEIAQAQWVPREEARARYKMTADNDDDDENSYDESDAEDDDDDSGPEIFKEIIDENFTIDNIGQVSMQVKSEIQAVTMLNWTAPTFELVDGNAISRRGREGLLSFAMQTNDTTKFRFLVDMDIYFTSQKPESLDESDSSRLYSFPEDQFRTAIKLGRTDMLASVIRRTGAGMPLEHLVKKSGVEMKVKPRFYQGLTVYGKKRSDWANAGRNLVVKATGSKVPPLLTAALSGSLPSVEWFISDTPMRQYLEFGNSKTAKDDPRLKHLSQSPGGFDRAILKWLGIQNDLVIHCAVLGPVGDETNKLLEYLIKVCPASFEAKSDLGYTPLYLACLLGRVQFAKTLIKAGADQSVKDKEFNNIIHAAVTNGPDLDMLRELLDLLDPEFRSHLFLQRNNLTHGGDTPLHYWLKAANPVPYENSYHQSAIPAESDNNVKILELLLEFSGGRDLEILNGSGDTCLHSAVFRQLPKHIKVMLEQNPKLLYRENAVGRTPGEIAYDRYIGLRVSRPKTIEITNQSQGVTSMVTADPETFIAKAIGTEPTRKAVVWEIVEDYMVKFPSKRRLVSLNEANDVALRIGQSYTWQRYYEKKATVDPDQDEEPEKQEVESDYVTVNYQSTRGSAWTRCK